MSRSFFTQNFLHEEYLTERLFTHRRVCIEAFTQRSLYTEELLHTKAFAHSKLLHTQGLLHREVFTQRSFLHTEGFTQRSLYPIAFAHKRLGAFTHRSCYTKSLHRYIAFFHSQTRLRTEAFTQRSLYTESFTHGSFYTQ